MAEVTAPWTEEQLASDAISKKQIVEFLHEKGSSEFLKKHKIFGKVPNIVKQSAKGDLITAFNDLFISKSFRNEELEKKNEQQETEAKTESATAQPKEAKKTEAAPEKPKYTKSIIKKGTGNTAARKGDLVGCRYRGMLQDGTVFDQNMDRVKGKLPNVLKFKVGTGKVIRGWDEVLLTMVTGEVAKVVIEPEWAYGKKGLPEAKIPPNAPLTFEVRELAYPN